MVVLGTTQGTKFLTLTGIMGPNPSNKEKLNARPKPGLLYWYYGSTRYHTGYMVAVNRSKAMTQRFQMDAVQ